MCINEDKQKCFLLADGSDVVGFRPSLESSCSVKHQILI